MKTVRAHLLASIYNAASTTEALRMTDRYLAFFGRDPCWRAVALSAFRHVVASEEAKVADSLWEASRQVSEARRTLTRSSAGPGYQPF
jgi:hypothetical protein